MVRKKLDDARRDENEKKHFPWWWQMPREMGCLDSVMESPLGAWSAFRYELGRRYLIRHRGMPASQFPSVSDLFFGDLPTEQRVFHAFASSATPGSLSQRPIAKVNEHMTFEDINECLPGQFQRLDGIAWNLEAPWRSVVEALKNCFEVARITRGIKKATRAGCPPKPRWQKIEILDLWEAGCDTPGHVYPKGGVQSHEKKAKEATMDGEKYSELTAVLVLTFEHIYSKRPEETLVDAIQRSRSGLSSEELLERSKEFFRSLTGNS